LTKLFADQVRYCVNKAGPLYLNQFGVGYDLDEINLSSHMKFDCGQALVARELDILFKRIRQSVSNERAIGWKEIVRLFKSRIEPRGLYIHGSVGSGKTMLMDRFYQSLSSLDASGRLHTGWRHREHWTPFIRSVQTGLIGYGGTQSSVKMVADEIKRSRVVLCLDEVHINDVAEGHIASAVLSRLLQVDGPILVMTSNSAPLDLFKRGDAFDLGARSILKNMKVVGLSNEEDYRMKAAGVGRGSWIVSENTVRGDFKMRQGIEEELLLQVDGRQSRLGVRRGDAVLLDFDQACRQPRSAGEYIAMLTGHDGCSCPISCVYLVGVPLLTADDRDAARRLIRLVDAIYDAGSVNLVVGSAAKGPREALPVGIFDDAHERLAAERTVSRLFELTLGARSPYSPW
jgi:cell division protein ZapE